MKGIFLSLIVLHLAPPGMGLVISDLFTFNHTDYKCFEPDKCDVDLNEVFQGQCQDDERTSYPIGGILTSCCECFIYTCTEVRGALPKGFAIWKRTVSEKCCLHCDGTVYKDGLEMTPVDVGGVCDAVETSLCRFNPDTGKAEVVNEYHYKRCCPDDKGKNQRLGAEINDAQTCSKKVCKKTKSYFNAVWFSTKVHEGCDCCEVDNEIHPDGYKFCRDDKLHECCKGKVVLLLDDKGEPQSCNTSPSTTTAKPTTTSTSTTTTSTTTTITITTTTTPTTSTTSTISTTTVTPTRPPPGYQGCFQDCKPRTLPYREAVSNSMTPQLCIDTCLDKNYTFAGVQFSKECWCGNSLPPVRKPDSECNKPCTGDSTQMCGGGCRNSVYRTSPAGFIVTGGQPQGYVGKRVELHDLTNNRQCRLPDLPDITNVHTQNGRLVCGGSENGTSCLTFSGGEWVKSHNLLFPRYFHTSWVRPDGTVMLMGGRASVSSNTTEVLNSNGSSAQSFDLKYPSGYSCAIDEGYTFFITGGGSKPFNKVSRYNVSGWVEDLSNLIQGRYNHGCSQYFNNLGVKTNLVCGGYDAIQQRLSSCEINVVGEDNWSLMTSLPDGRVGVRGLTIDNRVFMTGGWNSGYKYSIYELNFSSKNWTNVGNLLDKRRYHAVSVVDDTESLWQYCK